MFFENRQEEVFCEKILPFLDAQTWGKLRRTCKYLKHIIDEQWEKGLKKGKEKTNKYLEKAAKHGCLKLVEFLITNETTKKTISSQGANQALKSTKYSDILRFLLANQTIKQKITHDTINSILPAIGAGIASFQYTRKNRRNIAHFLLNTEEITEQPVNKTLVNAAANNHLHIVKFILGDILTTDKVTAEGIDQALAQAHDFYEIKYVLRKFKGTGEVPDEIPAPRQHISNQPFPRNPWPMPIQPDPWPLPIQPHPFPLNPFPLQPGRPFPFPLQPNNPNQPNFFSLFNNNQKK